MKLLLKILLLCVSFTSCKQPTTPLENSVDNINVATILTLQPSKVLLSHFATDFTYLRPETNENSLFTLMGIEHIDSSYMILYEKKTQQRYLYKRSGELVGKIGVRGQGPGEYIGIDDVFLWDNLQEIHLLENSKNRILRFGLDLQYKGEIKLNTSPAAIEIYNNKYYICAFTETVWTKEAENDLYLKDPSSFDDIKILLKNVQREKPDQIGTPSDLRWFLSKDDTIYYAREVDEKIEIFEIADEVPVLKYILDLKEYHTSPRNPFSSFIVDLMFFDKYLMITLQSNVKIYTGYYNTETKTLENFNIINDLDMGLEFYPMGYTRDGGYHSDDLKINYFTNHWNRDNEKDHNQDITCKYPEKARWLKDTLSRSLEDNPLIMVIYGSN